MRTTFRTLALAAVLGAAVLPSFAQDGLPFTNGTVYRVSTVRTGANSQEEYLKHLDKYWYPTMAKAKQLGLIKDFKILAGLAANEGDYDVMLIVTLDKLGDMDPDPARKAKWEQLHKELDTQMGGTDKREVYMTALNLKRTILGEKVLREQVHQ